MTLNTRLHQSSAMALAINVVAAFLALLAATATAVPAPFPHGKTLVYKYYGDVKAGIIEPAAYASQFALEGLLRVKHHTNDPNLKNAYYVSLTNAKSGMYNGMAAHYQPTNVFQPITEPAKVIQDPFLIVYDDNGKLEGVKIMETEPGWSKNMKMAMASMLQLDLMKMKMEKPLKANSFITKENTIHGDCWINYDVHVKDQFNPDANKIVVTKFSSPKNCSGFSINTFDHVDKETCQTTKEEPVNVASRRVFDIEKQGEEIIITKLVAHGGSNYFPWNARSEAHYVLTNATFVLDHVSSSDAETDLPMKNFKNVPMTRDVTYRKPLTNYATNAAVDVTQGRRKIDQTTLVPKMKKMLGEAADYLEENHLEMKEPDWKHGQTINRILQTTSYMDIDALTEVHNEYQDIDTPKTVTIKNIFFSMISQVGTKAACLFTLNLIRQHKISDVTAIEMLTKLPLNVKQPSEEFLLQMEDLVKLSDSVSIEVRKAGILCFSTMIYRTMKKIEYPETSDLLSRYLQHFFEHLKSEPTYEMKVVYLMAMRNVEYVRIHEILAPIIRGDLEISEKPENIRLMAIWAIEKSIENHYDYAHDLLWPVMADLSLPIKLRIAAYDILMNQAPSMTDVLHMYWFMVYERNEHLYNYHHTTIKGIANSVDPCKLHLRELVRKIMRFTKIHDTVHYTLSSAGSFDYKDEKYNHAQKIRTGIIVNEMTGVPEVLNFEHIVTDARKPVSNMAVRLHIQGCEEMMTLLKHGQFKLPTSLTNENVLNLLRRVASDMLPMEKKINVDIVLLYRGRVIMANHYNERSLKKLYDDVKRYIDEYRNRSKDRLNLNYQQVIYDHLYEKQVTSDMGLPVMFENRVPLLSSLKMTLNTGTDSTPMAMNVEIDGKIWRHGDYSISIYNPIADVWHSIRRSTATDITLPIHAYVAYNAKSNNFKITLPRLPATNLSIAGALTHAKDCVTVNEDDKDALKESCPTCHIQEVVTRGVTEKKYHQTSFDSKDTGLQYSMGIFDCESGLTPVTMTAEWLRALTSDRKNDWNNGLVRFFMAIHQQMKNILVSPSMGSCGSLVKIEPSINHPTSRVDISLRGSFEDVDHTNPSFHLFPSEKYNIRGTMDAIAASTETSTRSWDLNVNVDLNQGHSTNTVKVQLTRKTPGEKNLKICVDGQKTYSAMPADPLKLGITKEETNSKLTISAGSTEDDKCTRDETLMTLVMKGELTDEQKKKFNQDINTGACAGDTKNPMYSNPKNIIPKTRNCINDAIRFTTLRKYNLNIAYKKVPHEITTKIQQFEDIIRTYLLANLKYTMDHVEPGNVKINVEYPMQKEEMDVSMVTPARSYDLIDVNFEKPRFNGFGTVVKNPWTFPLDSTRFSIPYLYKYTHDMTKMCSIYPDIIQTGDGGNMPYKMTEKWTLISGNYVEQNFAIFVKKIGNNMGVKIFNENHVIEILPNASNNVRVTIDGEIVGQLENGVLVPADPKAWILKVTEYNDHVIVQMKGIPIFVTHGINHVALAIDTQLQGKLGGLCGHLDGTYAKQIPPTYGLVN